MKLKSMDIEGLFNTFSYSLGFDSPAKYLILTGVNGYGKTTILNMISCLANRDLYYFYTVPFKKVIFTFDDDSTFRITAEKVITSDNANSDTALDGDRTLSFKMEDKNGNELGSLIINREIISEIMDHPFRYTGVNVDRRIKDSIGSTDFYNQIKDGNLLNHILRISGNHAEQLMMSLDSFHASYLEAERTVECKYLRPKNMLPDVEYKDPKWYIIDFLRSKFTSLLHDEYMAFLKYSQRLDSEFIDKAIHSDALYNADKYNLEAKKLTLRIKELEQMGLIPHWEVRPYDEANAKMLTSYLVIQNEKLNFYNQLIKKIHLFKDLVNERKFINKEMVISLNEGFRFISSENGFISLSSLSSGEQNEIVILYTLVFEVKDNTMLLLDEPENSLHVLWQKTFMKSIEQIANLRNIFVVVATHSPQIIGSRWDNCYDLTEAMNSDGE